MEDASQPGHHAGWQHQDHQAESTDSSDTGLATNTDSTGSSDTDPATNTKASGGIPRRTTNLAMAALVQESQRLANASLGRAPLPQSASNANATIGIHGGANSLNPENRLAMLNQYLEPLQGPNTVLEGSIQALNRLLQRSNNNNNVTDTRQRFDGRFADLENRINGVVERLQALDGQLQRSNNNNDITDMRQRVDGRFADLENRINGVMELLQTFDIRLMQLERGMARQTDAANRLANRVSRTNQRLDRLERRAPEEDDYENSDYWPQVEEFIRKAVRDSVRDALHPTWAPPYSHDALAPPPYRPQPYGLQPLGVPPHVLHSPGMPPSGLIPNGTPMRIPLHRIDRAANRLVRLDAYEETTNEEAMSEEVTNGEAMDGVTTNGNANDPARVVVLRLDHLVPSQHLPIRPPNSQRPNSRHTSYRHPHLS
ncbi:hypothetical protein THAR02_09033 [Trichoderma harzianum]|uniref:Uncharacterized protein n=1 Tax=Trichoderma harzianum TaxID=5544 RepID=A0A0G0A0I2_TRIHA|nr:hypothetical protein THAR02_09033 [Trichoderma harzianum]